MIESYFSKLPVITYNDFQVRNISERVAMVTKPKIAPFSYYPYELANELRPDQIAGAYYQDPALDWMIWIVNDIVDPYYGWHLYDIDFENYIADKYGDIATAEQTVAFWRTNWPSDPNEIAVTYFDNLDGAFKKYYEPVWGPKKKIMSYKRKQDDMKMNVNKIVSYDMTMTTGNAFSNGELLIINYLGDDIGRAQCITANDSIVVAKNLVDNCSIGTIRSRANTSIEADINSVTNLSIDIPDVEGAFWEPVSYFDVETEANENKRFIQILGTEYVQNVSEAIRKSLLANTATQRRGF